MRSLLRAGTLAPFLALWMVCPLLAAQKPVTASKGWIRLPAANETEAMAFVVVDNPTMYDVYIVSASSEAAKEVQLRETPALATGPRTLKEIAAPAYGQLEMTPNGVHLALVGLTRPLNAGDTATISLVTDGDITLQVAAVVKP